jgi:hypothetical protein
MSDAPERSSAQVWALGVRVLLVQVVTLALLWALEALFVGG